MKKIDAEVDTTSKDFFVGVLYSAGQPAFFRYNENFTLVRDFYVAKSRTNLKFSSVVPEEGWFGQPKYSTPTKKSFYVVSTSAPIFFSS